MFPSTGISHLFVDSQHVLHNLKQHFVDSLSILSINPLAFLVVGLLMAMQLKAAPPVTKTLNVNSLGASHVVISSSTGHGGTTDYPETVFLNTTIELSAPATASALAFHDWVGCDSSSSTDCTVVMDANKTVTARYGSGYDHFVTTWKTNNPGATGSTSISIPMVGGPYQVDWNNDMVFDENDVYGEVQHNFGSTGTYTIRIKGNYDSIKFSPTNDRLKILSVDQWGTHAWKVMKQAFWSAANLTVPAVDTPDFSQVTSMDSMFNGATLVNPDTSNWDTSSVTSMKSIFEDTSANPDTSHWDTSKVTDMRGMFSLNGSANPNTSGWDTSKVTNMSYMFYGAASAMPDTGNWDTSQVTDMSGLFNGAVLADPDTSGWNTSSVTDMSYMFWNAELANPDTSRWDTSKVTDMQKMFYKADVANPVTSDWDTSAVTDMNAMFQLAKTANPDVSGWDTAKVTDMNLMFAHAYSFDQDIGWWDVSALTDATDMFFGVTLSPFNYDGLLLGWSDQSLHSFVSFHGGYSEFCSLDAEAAKVSIESYYSWVIDDGGGPSCTTDPCNRITVSGATVNSAATYKACDVLVIDTPFMAQERASVKLYGGMTIQLMPGFSLDQGARLEAHVCGQSLCSSSDDNPMPFGCHPCVDRICSIDESCCTTAFNDACLAKVDTVCGLVCE